MLMPTAPASPTISRRALLAAAAFAPFGAPSGVGILASARPTTFVLVHGAWHGGWCWTKLTPLLRAAGHQVYTPTLTGLGERSHLLTSEVGLDTHIRDVTAVLEYEDLRDVVLVGHSYGGMVITGVAAADAARRLAHLVYLDAFLPEPGRALTDYAPVPPTKPDGWRVPPPATARQFGVSDERDAAWTTARLGDQPLRAFTQPLPAATAVTSSVRRTFIQCTTARWFAEAAERARRQGFQSRELLSAGHDAMLSQPGALARLLFATA
jgi:pimeloyl-ACP methyl ester carboxylesterase